MSAALAPALDYTRPLRPRRRHLTLVSDELVSDPAPIRPTVRLTVRGRRAVLVLVAALALLGAMTVTALASGSSGQESVTVRSGQTLSDIAREQLPQLPVGTAVAHLQMANQLNSNDVSAGQRLVVPSS